MELFTILLMHTPQTVGSQEFEWFYYQDTFNEGILKNKWTKYIS